jgi:hypothetical protein
MFNSSYLTFFKKIDKYQLSDLLFSNLLTYFIKQALIGM